MNVSEKTSNELPLFVMNEKHAMVMRHTNYTIEEVIELLQKYNDDEIMVIKNYLSITHTKPTDKLKIVSLNQEIYKQIRSKLNSTVLT